MPRAQRISIPQPLAFTRGWMPRLLALLLLSSAPACGSDRAAPQNGPRGREVSSTTSYHQGVLHGVIPALSRQETDRASDMVATRRGELVGSSIALVVDALLLVAGLGMLALGAAATVAGAGLGTLFGPGGMGAGTAVGASLSAPVWALGALFVLMGGAFAVDVHGPVLTGSLDAPAAQGTPETVEPATRSFEGGCDVHGHPSATRPAADRSSALETPAVP